MALISLQVGRDQGLRDWATGLRSVGRISPSARVKSRRSVIPETGYAHPRDDHLTFHRLQNALQHVCPSPHAHEQGKDGPCRCHSNCSIVPPPLYTLR